MFYQEISQLQELIDGYKNLKSNIQLTENLIKKQREPKIKKHLGNQKNSLQDCVNKLSKGIVETSISLTEMSLDVFYEGEKNEEAIRDYRKSTAQKRFQNSLDYFLEGMCPLLPLIESLLLDKKTVMFEASLLEDWSEHLDEFLKILDEYDKELGITGNELDEFFAAKVRG